MHRTPDEKMIVVSKDRTSLINMENTVSMYISVNDISIKANVANGNLNVMKMGNYQTMAEAEKAFKMLLEEMRTRDICYLPTDETVRASMVNDGHGKTIQHTATGKKIKGHGGS